MGLLCLVYLVEENTVAIDLFIYRTGSSLLCKVFKNWTHLGRVSKYPFPTKKKEVSLEKCPTLGQGREVRKMKVEHLVIPESKENHWRCVQRTRERS